MKLWLACVIATIICWGAYVPVIHAGQTAIGGKARGLWAFLFVGAAYFLFAVLAPVAMLAARNELNPMPTSKGMWLSVLAGVLGAAGALGVILAFLYDGSPAVVPALVFAGAPIMSILVALAIHPPKALPDPRFFCGIVLAAAGAALVLRYKPA